LLLNGGVEGAREVAERMRRTIQKKCVPEREGTLERPVTVSLGVAPLTEEIRSLERLIAIADAEMYRAKKTGKNTVSVFLQDG
jgi:two-component system, cell cycle response regulator